MTSKERVMTALDHKIADMIPFTWGNGIADIVVQNVCNLLQLPSKELTEKLLYSIDDVGDIMPEYIGPANRHCSDGNGHVTDEWGVGWIYRETGLGGRGDPVYFPLAEAESPEEIMEYSFPDADWWNYEGLNAKIDAANADGEKAIRFSNANPLEVATWLLGYETLYMDMIAEPEMVHAVMRCATDYFKQYMTRALDAVHGRIDIVITADDLGGQNGLLMSPAAIREFIMPYHKEVNDIIHSYGVKVMYHSCGSVIKAVDQLIDSGVDCLESVQLYTTGMTPEALKDGFGDRICFQGGSSVQKTLVAGKPEDVIREAEWLKRELGRGGGYILAPSHHVQSDVPPENILALIEAAGRTEEFFANVNKCLAGA